MFKLMWAMMLVFYMSDGVNEGPFMGSLIFDTPQACEAYIDTPDNAEAVAQAIGHLNDVIADTGRKITGFDVHCSETRLASE